MSLPLSSKIEKFKGDTSIRKLKDKNSSNTFLHYICMNDDMQTYAERTSGGLSSLAVAALPLLRKIMHKKGMVSADIVTMWEQIVGEDMAQYTFPEKLEFSRGERNQGTLWLKVPGGAFALELRHREKFVIDKVNTFFGYNAVANLRIAQKKLVSKEEEIYIKEVTGDIANAELKEKLQMLGEAVFNQNRE